MIFSENDRRPTKKTVLVAPLDWGLGHAARCIPVIRELHNYPLRIIIAADGPVKKMLEQEFPHLEFTHLPGYQIKYSKNKRWFRLRLMIQFPGVLYSVMKEHRWLKKTIKELSVNAVISDNRFGLFNHSVPCFYITHQLSIKTGNRIFDYIATLIHQKCIKNYTQCWIPDFEGKKNLAGQLSQSRIISPNISYLGCLSRFEKACNAEKDIDLLVLISGPEPQRTIFENVLLQQVKNYQYRVWLVRGLPAVNSTLPAGEFSNNIVIKNHLAARELNNVMQRASFVVSRSGYTTIMDLVKVGGKGILVPTPGQTEQEYLADYLSGKNIFLSVTQDTFQLQDVIEKARNFSYQIPVLDMDLYKTILRQFAETI